ncbi:MAG TPA: helix-turn-helix domain-containing protein [Acidimicrobiales bacterium]|nr:helix-turn-helix domain-containing protein [Acidimicrobiales bacterium]
MVKPTPAVVRAGRVLELFAANPSRPFTLSEISERIDVNRSSLLAVLHALVETGLLARHARHRTYELGPAAVSLGHAAFAQHPEVEAARTQMAALAEDLGVEALAAVPIGNEVVIVATAGRPRADGPVVRVGHRLPLGAPLGAVFVAWSQTETIARWAARFDAVMASEWEGLLATVRSRGWALTLDSDPRRLLGDVLEERSAHGVLRSDVGLELVVAKLGGVDYQLGELERSTRYQVSTTAAPVFDADGQVVLALALHGFDNPLDVSTIERVASRLMSSARAVTRAVHGREPTTGARHG